jgi:DNA-binding response OmpR family regulator
LSIPTPTQPGFWKSACASRSLRTSTSAISHHRSISSQGDYGRYDIAIVNHNLYDDSFSKCFLLKQRNPTLQTVVITSPGDSLRHLLSLRVNTDMIDEVVDKPVHFQTLARSFEALLKRRPLLMPDTWNATCPPA